MTLLCLYFVDLQKCFVTHQMTLFFRFATSKTIAKMVQTRANVLRIAVPSTVVTSVTGLYKLLIARNVTWHTLGWLSRELQAHLERDPQKITQQVWKCL